MRERLSLTLKKLKWKVKVKVKVIMALMAVAYSIITIAYLPSCLYASRPTGSVAMHVAKHEVCLGTENKINLIIITTLFIYYLLKQGSDVPDH